MNYYIPGSRRNRIEEPQDPEPAGLTSGRFTEMQIILLTELANWWSIRRGTDDSDDPITTLIGGVDNRGTARTTGTTPASITFDFTIYPAAQAGNGRSFFVQAFGIPDPDTVGEVYSIVAICHFYYDGSSWLSRYNTIGRAPSGTTSTEIRTAVSGLPEMLVIGVTGITIDWTVNSYMIEL